MNIQSTQDIGKSRPTLELTDQQSLSQDYKKTGIRARDEFFSKKIYVKYLIDGGDFSPEEMIKLSLINKFFYSIIFGQEKLNNYWCRQYKKHEYPLILLNKDNLLMETLEGNPETDWYKQFSQQKYQELDEKNFYSVMIDYAQKKEEKNEDKNELKLRDIYRSKTSILIEFAKDLIEKKWKNSLIKTEIVTNKVDNESKINYIQSIKLKPLICDYERKKEILKKHHLNILFRRNSCSYEFKFAQRFFKNFDKKNMDYMFSIVYFDDIDFCDKELDLLLEKKCPRTIAMKIKLMINSNQYNYAFDFINKYKNDDKIGLLNYTLGLMYSKPAKYGNVVQENFEKTFEEMNIAVSKKYPPAGYILGKLYLKGLGVEKNENKGLKIINTYANNGCIQSQKFMIRLFFKEKYEQFSKNLEQVFKYLTFAAKGNDKEAIYTLGYVYESGQGCERNINEAIKNYELAANRGYPEAMYKLGILYETGKGVEQNKEKALDYYTKASFFKHKKAILNASISFIKINGFSIFEKQLITCKISESLIDNIEIYQEKDDLIEVRIWLYEKFINLGKCQDPLIICGLVDILLTFEQGKKITEVMIQHLNKALPLLNNVEIPKFHYSLGLCYFRGFGTPVNFQLAKEHLQKATELKHEKASVLYQKIEKREKRKRKLQDI